MLSGRPFLQIPGPTNVPDRVLRAMSRPMVDHRSPEFAALTQSILAPLREVYGTREGAIVLYPTSGTGAWEASLVNVLRPGDRVLAFNYGHFSAGFAAAARNLGFVVDEFPLRWGQELPPSEVQSRLKADGGDRRYRALLVVHNETSTGVQSDVGAIRAAMDSADHDALLIVDAVSSLASVPFRFDDWGVDVCLAGSQKGLMLPPGLGLLSIGPRALAAAEFGGSPRNFFDWRTVIHENVAGFYPYTPATLLMYGLQEALRMLVDEEGLVEVYARHRRLAGGVRAAVAAWRLPIICEDSAFYSQTLTAVAVPDGVDSDDVIGLARRRYGLGLGVGLGRIKGRVFRIGHLGALNELEILATLAGIEMTLMELGAPIVPARGVEACQRFFLSGTNTIATEPVPNATGPAE